MPHTGVEFARLDKKKLDILIVKALIYQGRFGRVDRRDAQKPPSRKG